MHRYLFYHPPTRAPTVGKDEFCDTNHLIETILHVVLRVIMPFDFGDNHFASVYCKNKKNTFFFFCFNRMSRKNAAGESLYDFMGAPDTVTNAGKK